MGFGALYSTVNSVPSVDPSICQLNIRPPVVSFLPLNAIRHILRLSGSLMICIQNSLFTLLAHSPFVLKAFDVPYRALSSDEALTRNPCAEVVVKIGLSSQHVRPHYTSGHHINLEPYSNL